MIKWLKGLIPRLFSNGFILSFFEFLRKIQVRRKKNFDFHYDDNCKAIYCYVNRKNSEDADSYVNHSKYIENQQDLHGIKYGKYTLAYSGCEVIAVYNALKHFGLITYERLPAIIRDFEHYGMVLSGMFGTSPLAIRKYLEKNGLKTRIETCENSFDLLEKSFSGFILTFYNDKIDITKEIHTVFISKNDSGFIAHNVYGNGQPTKEFNSIKELIYGINNGKAKGILLIGIM